MKTVIRLENIRKTYHPTNDLEVPVLRGVELTVEEGEYVAIMGPSGSGKSTMLNIIGCTDVPDPGSRYFLDNEEISRLSEDQVAIIRNKKLGYIFQSFNLLARTSALENVELPLLYAGGIPPAERIRLAREALEAVGLGDRLNNKPNELSGGQQQRVSIARAIVNHPSLLIADEPTGNLDSVVSEEIMGIFQRLNDEGRTVIMVTHEPDIARHTKRLVRFRDGIIVSDEVVENRTLVSKGGTNP